MSFERCLGEPAGTMSVTPGNRALISSRLPAALRDTGHGRADTGAGCAHPVWMKARNASEMGADRFSLRGGVESFAMSQVCHLAWGSAFAN